jgi:hypothetical protein
MLGAGREDMNQYWGRHRSDVEDQPVAQLEDLEWADGIARSSHGRKDHGLPTSRE